MIYTLDCGCRIGVERIDGVRQSIGIKHCEFVQNIVSNTTDDTLVKDIGTILGHTKLTMFMPETKDGKK